MADGDNIPMENKTVADGDDRVTVEYKPNADAEAHGVDGATSVGKTPLTPVHQRRNSRIPILFERAAKSWWDPKFDTSILEEQHEKIFLPQTRKRFQYALCYIILSCIAWCVFFAVMQQTSYWIAFLSGCVILMVITASVLGFTFTRTYERYVMATSVFISIIVGLFCLMYFIYPHKDMSAVGAFTGSIEILLMMYTVIPLPLYMCVGIGVTYSIIFELLSDFITDMNDVYFIMARVLIHTCIHLIGVHIFIMSQVRRRSTFLKVGQSIMSHSDLEVEKSLKHQIIHSLMPPQVAAEVMKSHGQDDQKKEDEEHHNPKKTVAHQLNFRSFHMDQMDNVSILFADIVGFTKMSSNKTAEQLVSLLNDLFGRFDEICKKCGCEKISTLGDCYYCVSGCPEPREGHAICCVDMGLAMCKAIEEFDHDHNEEVDMRVGVHTGSVLCGLVGTRRFKFDVWSHDVTLANTMESTGKPGRVHISDQTLTFVKDRYEVDPGDDVQG
ncbi:hypothetical protein LSH36_54g01025 [Paralvinella palmiformis]|uniref:adenylate cyclase n=1 Tax=Paralvinella palmiformis TaxID=53620 RepID=A0AAD9NFC3_9ANNE|nr:hypothetical protein LSH36_54g01025 [Paralvinella palmiformis]